MKGVNVEKSPDEKRNSDGEIFQSYLDYLYILTGGKESHVVGPAENRELWRQIHDLGEQLAIAAEHWGIDSSVLQEFLTGHDFSLFDKVYTLAGRLDAKEWDVELNPGEDTAKRKTATRHPLNPTLEKAAAYIRQNPGANSGMVAKHCDIEARSFRNMAPKLKEKGFTSLPGCTGGYYPPKAKK